MSNYTEPRICPKIPKDTKKEWYVWFRILHNGKWIQLRYKEGINKYHKLKERLAEANALRLVIRDRLKEGWSPFGTEVVRIYSIQEALNYILKLKIKTLKKKTGYAYTYIIGCFTDWLKDNNMSLMATVKLTGIIAQEYMDHLTLSKNYSGRTFNDHLIVLRTFFNCFIDREWITKNPFKCVKKKPQTIGRNHAYTEREKELLLKVLYEKDRRLYFFTQIMYHCFIRRTELTCLKVKHIDLVNKTIIIPGENAKNGNQESVVIPEGLEEVLKEMDLHKFNSEDYLFGRNLFTCGVQYKNPNWISTRHNDIVKNLGIDSQKGLYSWKHSGVCYYYYATGKDVFSVMRQLRHRDLNTTMIYLKSLGLIQNEVFRLAKIA